MNKKLWTILVSVLLIVTMSVCLFACTDAEQAAEENLSSSFKLRDGSTSSSVTKSVQIGTNTTIAVESKVDTTVENVAANFSFKDKDGNAVAVRVFQDDTKHFSIKAPNGGYATGWYNLTLLNSNLSFTQYPGANKLVISVAADADINAELGSNVIYLAAGSAAIYDVKEDDAMPTFKFDATIAGEMIKMGDTILVQDENGNYSAFKVWGVAATSEANVYTVSFARPSYDEIYEKFQASSSATLSDGTIAYSNYNEAVEALVDEVAAAGFDVGPVRIDANLDKETNTVSLGIKITIKDVLGEKDGANSLNLILEFDVDSKITADTNINIGALINKEDNNVAIKAVFDNTLTFTVKAQDGMTVTESSALDAVIVKIKNLIQNTDDAALSVPVFNWIIPIGNGVADVNFQVNAVLDFSFSGEIGVKSSSNAVFSAEVNYNPATGEKSANIEKVKGLTVDSVEIDVDANAAVYLGVEAAIKFELLAGVLSVGVGAEVGNYNRIYGSLHTTNLLESTGVNYGYYIEGGIYYDVKFLYSIAKIKTGDISFLGGRQEKQLYDAGSRYVVTYLADSKMTISDLAQDIKIDCLYRDIVAGTAVTDLTNIIDATKISEVSEGDGTNDYVVIEKGKIALTETGKNQSLTNYEVRVKADGVEATILVSTVPAKSTSKNTEINLTVDAGVKVVTAEYVDGDVLTVTKDGTNAQFVTAGEGVIIVKADGKVIAMYKVA